MKTFVTVAAAAALFAIPTAVQAQAFVQAEAGVDSVSFDGESEAGFAYGVTAGYDLPLSSGMFVGVQGTYSDGAAKRCLRDVYEAGDKACIEAGRDVAALVRLGTTVGEKGKLYVMGGYANARADVTYNGPSVDDIESELGVGLGLGGHADLDGLRVGAGYEYALGDKYFVKAEYRYSNYEQGVSRHSGVVGLGVKF